jgi:hypothetical protein
LKRQSLAFNHIREMRLSEQAVRFPGLLAKLHEIDVLPHAGIANEEVTTLDRLLMLVALCRACETARVEAGQQVERLEEPSNNAPGSQESALFADFSDKVLNNRRDASWGRISLLTQTGARRLPAVCACERHSNEIGWPLNERVTTMKLKRQLNPALQRLACATRPSP